MLKLTLLAALACRAFCDELEDAAPFTQSLLQLGTTVATRASTLHGTAGDRAPSECNSSLGRFLSQSLVASLSERSVRQLHAAIAAETRPLLLLGTRQEICMLDNFLVHANNTANPSVAVVHVSLDHPVYVFCSRRATQLALQKDPRIKLRCLDFSDWLPLDTTDMSDDSQVDHASRDSSVGFGSCTFQLITWAKPVVLWRAAEALDDSKRALFLDTDVILHGRLQDWCATNESPGTQLMAGNAGSSGEVNTGSVFVSKESVNLLRDWIGEARLGDSKGDQAGLNRALMKQNYSVQIIPDAVLGECRRSGGSYGRHYTCSAEGKVVRMKIDGVWQPTLAQCQ